jgi:hypothetical protein
MEEVIIRKKYLDKLIPFIGKQLIKVLTGQHYSGIISFGLRSSNFMLLALALALAMALA